MNQKQKKKRLKKWKAGKKNKLIQKPFPICILKAIFSWLFTNHYFILVYHCTLKMIQSMKPYSFSIVLKQFVQRWYSAIPSLSSTMLGKRSKKLYKLYKLYLMAPWLNIAWEGLFWRNMNGKLFVVFASPLGVFCFFLYVILHYFSNSRDDK